VETDGRDILRCGLGDRWKRYLEMWTVDLETDGRDILRCGLGDRWKRYLDMWTWRQMEEISWRDKARKGEVLDRSTSSVIWC